MPPSTERTISRSRAEKKTRSLIGREAQLRHFRRSHLAKDTTTRIVLHTRLARRRYSGKFGDGAWNGTKMAFSAAGKRRKVTQKRRRRRDKAFVAIAKEVRKAQEEVFLGTYAEKIAGFRRIEHDRKRKKTIKSELQSSAGMDSETVSKHRGAVPASTPKDPTEQKMPQTTRSASPFPTTREHIDRSNDRFRSQSYPAVPGESMGPEMDLDTRSSSQTSRRLSLLPLGPLDLVIPIESLPAWAHWFEPSLSAAQVKHVREQMKPPEEYLSLDPSQRDNVMTDDLSAALRSMCQTFDQSVKFNGKHAGQLKQLLLRLRGGTVGGNKNTPRPREAGMIDTVSFEGNNLFTGTKSADTAELKVERPATVSLTHRPLRANSTCSDSSFVSKRTGDREHSSTKRRTTSGSSFRLGHHKDVARGSSDVALISRRDSSNPTTNLQRTGERHKRHVSKRSEISHKPERVQKSLSGGPKSSMARTADIKKSAHPNKSKTAILSESTSGGYEDAERNVEEKKRSVNIPADTKMATDVRAYSQWPDDSGALKSAQGCLLPANYRFSGLQGFEWICPVRTCQRCFQSQGRLGSHFNASHYSRLLNDNCDGTFTILGEATFQSGNRRPTLVGSKTPLPMNVPPRMDPRPPARWASAEQEQLFAASQRKARSLPALDSSEEKTVDEMMLQPGCMILSLAGISGSSEPIEFSRTPSPRDIDEWSSQPEASSSKDSSPPIRAESDDEGTDPRLGLDQYKHANASHPPRDATQENWQLVKEFLAGIQFYPSKRSQFTALLSTPRNRNIVIRPGVTFLADQPKKIHLLIVHMTGTESSVSCDSCAQGRGPFEKCVAISQKAAGEITNGVVCCTNCASKRSLQQLCDLEEPSSQEAASQIDSRRKKRKEHLAPEPREQGSQGSSSQVSEIEIDSRFKRRSHFLPRDGSLVLNAEPSGVRLCSPTMGKVLVELEGNSPFLMGPHGMFTLIPVMSAEVSNASEVDAVLVVYTVKS